MCNLIGEKNSFGFEYNIQSRNSHVMGNTRLWIDGKYIGAFDDVNILSAILYQFEGLELKNTDGCKFTNKTVYEIYESINSETVPDSYRYHFSPGPAFDDFLIVTYVCNGKIFFIWKLVDNPFFEYPDYPEDIQSAWVSVDEFRKVVAEFKSIISAK